MKGVLRAVLPVIRGVRIKRCMPKEVNWGPVRLKKCRDGARHFFTATPQVFYWAYILERT